MAESSDVCRPTFPLRCNKHKEFFEYIKQQEWAYIFLRKKLSYFLHLKQKKIRKCKLQVPAIIKNKYTILVVGNV